MLPISTIKKSMRLTVAYNKLISRMFASVNPPRLFDFETIKSKVKPTIESISGTNPVYMKQYGFLKKIYCVNYFSKQLKPRLVS